LLGEKRARLGLAGRRLSEQSPLYLQKFAAELILFRRILERPFHPRLQFVEELAAAVNGAAARLGVKSRS
jgi:hypothetical protein